MRNNPFRVKNWPLFLQLFLSITFLFALFIVIQQFVNNGIFINYNERSQATSLKTSTIQPYISSLNNGSTTTEEFNANNLAISALLNSDLELISPNDSQIINKEVIDVDTRLKNQYAGNNYWYLSNDLNKEKTIVFINELDNTNYALTVFMIQSNDSIIATMNSYSIYVYIFTLMIICLMTWYLSKVIAKPIENITYVANEIANLNFKISAKEFTNRETTTLSNSINKMNNSLSNTISELNKQNKEIQELADKQANQFKMKKQLVSAISHELKTPLAIMQASISGIIDGVFDEKDSEYELKNVLKEINNTSEMLNEVLDVYRLDNDSFHLEIETLDLVSFTQRIINSFETVIKNTGSSVSFTYDENPIHIDGDYRQLKRAITNFLVNAIKYSPNNTNVQVKISTSQKDVLFEIFNYGVTIPEQDLPNIFEPFYRVDKTGNRTERKKGSGLGLYIVREILNKHGFEFGIRNIENGVCSYFYAKKANQS